jgi:hypothetical protein
LINIESQLGISRKPAEDAAAALYFLVACRLVDQTARADQLTVGACDRYVVSIASNNQLICAIIVTAIFGGQLKLVPANPQGLPRPEAIFEVAPPNGGDWQTTVFERAAWLALFPNDARTPQVTLNDGPLDSTLAAALAGRINTIRNVELSSLALLIQRPESDTTAASRFAETYQVPVAFQSSQAIAELIGMSTDRLLVEIGEFWNEIGKMPETPHSPRNTGGSTMPGPTFNINANTVALSTGDQSLAQAGSGNVANLATNTAPDLAALVILLKEINAAVSELPSEKGRKFLAPIAEAALMAADQPDLPEKPDGGAIQRAVDRIKTSVELLEGGEKLYGLCNQAYNAVAPFLGLPPTP